MTSQDTPSLVADAAPATAAMAATGDALADAPVPTPAAARAAAPAPPPAATTWITKEAGNRRLPFDPARLERSIDAIHAEFPQLEIDGYKRAVLGFVARKQALSADDLVDHLIREAEARVDLAAPEWEYFAARLYLRRLYKRASRNRFYDVAQKYG
ncbi:MAG: ribonucleoside-diphosphate reductase subunit alpha, partial [Lysobacteraceae bacterium]